MGASGIGIFVIIEGGAPYQGVAAQGYRAAEVVVVRVRGKHFADLAPVIHPALVALKQVDRSAVDSVLLTRGRTDGQCVSFDRHRIPEPKPQHDARRIELSELPPVLRPPLVSFEQVSRAFLIKCAGVPVRADNDPVAVDRNRVPEMRVSGTGGRQQFAGLSPVVRAPQVALKNVRRTRPLPIVVILGRTYNRRVSLDRHGFPEKIPDVSVGGQQLRHLSPIVRSPLIALVHQR